MINMLMGDNNNDDDDDVFVHVGDSSAHVNAMCRLIDRSHVFIKTIARSLAHHPKHCWISMRQIFGSQPADILLQVGVSMDWIYKNISICFLKSDSCAKSILRPVEDSATSQSFLAHHLQHTKWQSLASSAPRNREIPFLLLAAGTHPSWVVC